jgi:WD40 repeat protein/transcriptional regulator with XRE-family HTH domain
MPTSNVAVAIDNFVTFGDLLRYLRRRAGLTQRELAIGVGYSDGQISRLEQNLRLPDLATIPARFAPVLELEKEPALLARLMELAAAMDREDAPASGSPPFKGLQYFDEADADLFFGRETVVAGLLARLGASPSSDPPTHFLAIVGASGSGKSSIVRAGLIPALRWNHPSSAWHIHVLTPTGRPLESLAASLTREAESVSATATLIDDLAHDPRSLHLFVRRMLGAGPGLPGNERQLGAAPSASPDARQVLLVVDQFEELFTLCRDETERRAYVDNLMAAAEPGGTTSVVVTLRADFYAHCAPYDSLREAMAREQEYIGPMTADDLRRAIEEPLRRGGWAMDPGLVDVLLEDVHGEPGALPLLSHALLETWHRRRGRTLTLSGYLASGGVRGAIAETAEAVFQDQLTPQQRAIARRIFLRLTELGESEAVADTRRRVTFDELISNPEDAPALRETLTMLADARLITMDKDTAEVAHEALIREWPTLRGWLEDDRESLRFHRHLTETAREWSASNREQGMLYRGARLAQAREWAAEHSDEMNDLEREFIDASQASAEREVAEREAQRDRELEAAQKLAETEKAHAEEQDRGARQLRRRAVYLTGALFLAVVAALATGVVANRNSTLAEQNAAIAITAQANFARAEQQARLAISRDWAAAAVSSIGADPDRSILLALQAVSVTYSVDRTSTAEAEEALHRTLSAAQPHLALRGHASGVNDVAFSPDGTRVATASLDGTAKVWDAVTGQELLILPTADAGTGGTKLYSVVFSPDGSQLATAGQAGSVSLWDASSGEALGTLYETGDTATLFALAFSPNGARVAGASADGTVRVWDLATAQVSLTLSIHLDQPPDPLAVALQDVAFSPDGTRLATVGPDKTAQVWDAVTGDSLLTLVGHKEVIFALAYSPDGTRIATASYDATTKVWDAETGVELVTVSGNTSRNTGVAFSPDGKRLAIVSEDGTAKVCDASTGQELFALGGHSSAARAVAFSRNGSRIATAGDDGTARVWEAAPSRELLTLTGHTQQVYRGYFSPDGTRLLTSSTEGKVKVWDAVTGQLSYTLSSDQALEHGAFSSDGKLVATGGADHMARIWDAATGRLLFTLRGHADLVGEVKFSPDGKRVATSSADKTAKLWDVTSGQVLLTLSGHAGGVYWLDFSPDGTRLITGGEDDVAIVWDLATGQPLFRLPMPTGVNGGVSYSPDGTRLLTVDWSEVAKVWDAATGQLLLVLSGHSGAVYGAAWSPDGTRIATASADKTAKLWDAVSGEDRLTLYGHTAVVGGVAFSPDGSRLATFSDDSTARVYVLPLEELVALAQSRVARSLTTEECRKYLNVEPCP